MTMKQKASVAIAAAASLWLTASTFAGSSSPALLQFVAEAAALSVTTETSEVTQLTGEITLIEPTETISPTPVAPAAPGGGGPLLPPVRPPFRPTIRSPFTP